MIREWYSSTILVLQNLEQQLTDRIFDLEKLHLPR